MSETEKQPYHHGSLHSTLLAAAEAEITEHGYEAFSLRKAARRAGVSHAAPSHHYGNSVGLLTALAAQGFRDFVATQRRCMAEADPDPVSQICAAGIGYVEFASARTALFRLMFSSDKPDFTDPDACRAAMEAFGLLSSQVAAIEGKDEPDVALVSIMWATAHGFADLLASGRLMQLQSMSREEREAIIVGAIRSQLAARGLAPAPP